MHRLLCLVYCVAAARAAPMTDLFPSFHSQFHLSHHSPPFHTDLDNSFSFSRNFWAEMNREIQSIENILEDLHKRLPRVDTEEGYLNSETYQIRIPLSGFTAEDIVVKLTTDLVMVEALQKERNEKRIIIKTLPSCLDVTTGTYVFENDILTISIKVKGEPAEDVVPVNNYPNTENIDFETTTKEREEIETVDENENKDMVIEQQEVLDNEIETNEISKKYHDPLSMYV